MELVAELRRRFDNLRSLDTVNPPDPECRVRVEGDAVPLLPNALIPLLLSISVSNLPLFTSLVTPLPIPNVTKGLVGGNILVQYFLFLLVVGPGLEIVPEPGAVFLEYCETCVHVIHVYIVLLESLIVCSIQSFSSAEL